MGSARKYWSDSELKQDAEFWRKREAYHRSRAELDPHHHLREANTAKLRAEASEQFLRKRTVNAEPATSRPGW